MKWGPSLLLLTLLLLPIFFLPTNGLIARFGWGGGASYSTYSENIVVQPSSTQLVTVSQTGSSLLNLPWLNPTYVSIYNTYYLQVLPNQEYISNNVSLSLSPSQIALNVTWLLASSSNTGSYGSIAIGYGVNFPSGFTGSYASALPYASDGCSLSGKREFPDV
ncbi:hypothetical protein [Saccharolobus islandicus]|uniref:hypothetical protein n=1 Tax=Saccharolobus islandicus TaxID=43080 RepID=UPI003D7D31F5